MINILQFLSEITSNYGTYYWFLFGTVLLLGFIIFIILPEALIKIIKEIKNGQK